MTLLPAPTSAFANSAAAPWGSARKKSGMSLAASAAASEATNDEPPVDPAHRGDHLGERLARVRARRDGGQLHLGVPKEQLHERLARVSRRAYDADFHGMGTNPSGWFKFQQ